MNFDLSEDQAMLRALAERFVTDRYDLARRRTCLAEPFGFSAENWRLLGELGLIAAAFGEASGGLGAGPVETIVLHEAMGRGLVVEPLIECAVFAGGLFEAVADAALAGMWLPALVSGERRLAVAHRELAARNRMGFVGTRAERAGGDWRLTGTKALVPGAVGADALIVSARVEGAAGDRAGVALFLVPPDAPGVSVRPWRLMDGSLAGAVTLADARLGNEAWLGGGIAALEEADARASLARSAEALGVMEVLLAATLDHLRTRKQFGAALSTFQALQHRMVAQYVAVEQSRSLLYRAAMADRGDRAERLRAIAGARAFIAEAGVALGHEAIQLHGGMGVSDELVVGHAHKRLFLLSRHPADAAAALDQFAGIAA